MKYLEIREENQKEMNNFRIIFAFSNKQLTEGMKKLGLKHTETSKLLSIGAGGFILKQDRESFHKLMDRMDRRIKENFNDPKFVYDMFNYELGNHEYRITYDIEPTLESLGLTIEEVNSNEILKEGLNKAIKNQKGGF